MRPLRACRAAAAACARAPVRSGSTLAEMAIALVLGGVAAIIGAGLLVTTERRVRRESTDDRAAQTGRDVAHVLGAELSSARLRAGGLQGDTAIDVDAHVGASVVCVREPDAVVLPAERTSSGAPFTFWRVPPEAGDVVLAWDTAGGAWIEAAAVSVSTRADGAGCPVGAFRTAADSVGRVTVTRIRFATPLVPSIGPGAPVRVMRAGRWVAYLGGDREWWLGYRRCTGGACAAVQPVAGPLAPPADGGLGFAVAADGSVTVTIRPQNADGSPGAIVRRAVAVRGAPRVVP